jgi:glycerol-3-phosphate cytidylyltransferase-like family protein
MKKKQRIYKNAVTFGRLNIPHYGHVELVQKMLEQADVANVYLSTGKKNADWDTRVLMLRHLLREEGVDLNRVNTLKASNPFSAVEDVMDTDNDAVVVLGEDQYELANKLCADYNLGGQLNRRSGSSTQVRELLDHGDFDIVEKIYRGDNYAARLAAILRKDELRVA